MRRRHTFAPVDRRQFLVRGALAGAALLAARRAPAQTVPFSTNPFTLGVASGDPSPGSVILWTRLAPDPLNGGGMPAMPVLVRWRVAADAAMRVVVQSGAAVAWPSLAHSVHVDVRGLQPDTWYFYQFSTGGEESAVGRTRTLPLPGALPAGLALGVVSCQDWQNGLYPAYRNLAREDLDLVVHLGDYMYEGGPRAGGPRQHPAPEVNSLASYRNRYALYKTDPHLQAAHAAFPWLVVPDDHEVENDYAGAVPENGGDSAAFLARRANAFRAYYEHMPLRLASFPAGPDMRLYRGLRWGTLAQVSALDTRQYRTDQPCNDFYSPRCPAALAESQTMTGAEQEAWLLDRLDRSSARWNVVAQQTMFAQFDFNANPEPGRELFGMDAWDGYVAARNRITRFLQARRPSNPIVLTGDIHSSWVHNVKADFDEPSSAVVGAEYVGPSITSGFPIVGIPFVKAALVDNPHTVFFDALFHGYLLCRVTPDLWRVDYRVVPTVLDAGVDAFTLASFVSVDGVPGTFPA